MTKRKYEPSHKRPRRKLSEAQLAQRRAAAPKGLAKAMATGAHTGPKTEEGKAVTSRNAWKHGRYSAIHRQQFQLGANSLSKLFGKPCHTTCAFHPENPHRTEAPCSLVIDGFTHAGGDCLDKTVYVNALTGILDALREGKHDGLEAQIAVEHASNFELLHRLRESIATNGVLITIPAVNKDGDLILDADGKPIPSKVQINPAIASYTMLMETMKINLPEMLLTPKARTAAKQEDDKTDAVQTLLGGIFGKVAAASQKRVTHDPDD